MTDPTCIGDYQCRAAPCDGDDGDPRPCTWREKCFAWQQECTALGLVPYLEAERRRSELGPDRFAAHVLELAAKWGPPPSLPPRRAPRRPPGAAARRRDSARLRRLEAFAWHIVDRLRDELGPDRFPLDAAVLVGHAYVEDRLVPHGRLDVHVRTGPTAAEPVACLTVRDTDAEAGVEVAVRHTPTTAAELAGEVGAVRVRELSRGRLPIALLLRRACLLEPLLGALVAAVEAARAPG